MTLPVGSVIGYWTFTLEDQETEAVVCDGQPYNRTSWGSLFGVTGGFFGNGDGVTTFNVPDLRGRFIRATDMSPYTGAANVDPDAATRTAMNPGGNSGNALGSVQGDAVASHDHGLENTFGVESGPDWAKSDSNGPDIWNTPTLANTGTETRPSNAAFVYVIMATDTSHRAPLGSVVAFGGNANPAPTADGDTWVLCDGKAYARSDYQDFYDKFQSWLGSGDGSTTFTTPDLRGYFLRGAPDPTQGIGVIEQDEFGSHVHGLSGSRSAEHVKGSDEQDMGAPGDGTPAGTTLATGGLETRPVNAYLHQIIRIL
jgi:microcystin-dependent protein